MLATIDGKLCRSTDGGSSWVRLRGGLPEFDPYPYTVHAIHSPDYAKDRSLFAGVYLGDTLGEGIYRSTDGGESWQPCTDGLYDLRVTRIVPSPNYAQDRTLLAYARAPQGEVLYRSSNGCAHWEVVLRQTSYGTPPLPRPQEFFHAAQHPPHFRCDYRGVCQRSADGGETWTDLDTRGANLDRFVAYALSPHYERDHVVYFMTQSDLYRFREDAAAWAMCTLSLFGARDYTKSLTSLAAAATSDQDHVLFVGSVAAELYRLSHDLLRWRELAPTPTPPTPVPTYTPCAHEVDDRFGVDEAGFPERLGCAVSPGQESPAAYQPFELGTMLWHGQARIIYVLRQDGTWSGYEDTWKEGQPDHDPALVPPQGLYQPVRGFGKVWRERLRGSEAWIGWATAPERAFGTVAQYYANGLLLKGEDELLYILYSDGTWETTSR